MRLGIAACVLSKSITTKTLLRRVSHQSKKEWKFKLIPNAYVNLEPQPYRFLRLVINSIVGRVQGAMEVVIFMSTLRTITSAMTCLKNQKVALPLLSKEKPSIWMNTSVFCAVDVFLPVTKSSQPVSLNTVTTTQKIPWSHRPLDYLLMKQVASVVGHVPWFVRLEP